MYVLYICKNPQFLNSSKPHLAHVGDGVAQSHADTIVVTSNFPPLSHQTTPPLQSDVGDHAHTFVEPSHLPTPATLDIYTYFSCKPVGCHMDLFPQPPSPHSIDPPDCTVLCSSIPNSSPTMNEDQVVDGVGVM